MDRLDRRDPGVNCQEHTKVDLLASLQEVLAEDIEFNRQEARDAAGEQSLWKNALLYEAALVTAPPA